MFIDKFRQNKVPTERCFVYGEDGRIADKALVSTGAFFHDKPNSFAYDSTTECMGALIIHDKKGRIKIPGQCAVLFENSAQPYIFADQEWAPQCQSKANILGDGRSEGISMVAGEIEDDARWERWMPVLYVVLAILGLVSIIACASAGLFSNVEEVF